MSTQDDNLHVSGETNLPDGSVLYIEAIGVGGSSGVDDFAYGEVVVSNNHFSTSLPVGGWASENAEVLIAFSNLNVTQPSDIEAQIGQSGEGIRGRLSTSEGHLGIFPGRRWAEEVITVAITRD